MMNMMNMMQGLAGFLCTSNISTAIVHIFGIVLPYTIKGILATPPKATPPKNKALIRAY